MGLWRHIYFFSLFTFFGLSLYAFGWGWVVQGCPDDSTALGALAGIPSFDSGPISIRIGGIVVLLLRPRTSLA